MKIAVVTYLFNAQRSRRIQENAERFSQIMRRDADLYGIALDFGAGCEIPGFTSIHGDSRNILWQKERLINIASQRVPVEYDAIAWIDADLFFVNPNWLEETERTLRRVPVAQLFESVQYTNTSGRIVKRIPSWAKASQSGGFKTGYPAPGGAWCARREIIDRGIYDRAIIGGGDALAVSAWAGKFTVGGLQRYTATWRRDWLRWAAPQYRAVKGRIGCVPGDVVHAYHGSMENRQYVSRIEHLARHDFDPTRDIRINHRDIWEWATDKPDMHCAVAKYFLSRKDDE